MCSVERSGGFNPRHALIRVDAELNGVVKEITFRKGCDKIHLFQCKQRDGQFACVEHCTFEALERRRLGFFDLGMAVGRFIVKPFQKKEREQRR